MTKQQEDIRRSIASLGDIPDHLKVRDVLNAISRNLPKTAESLELFETGYGLIQKIEDQAERRDVLIEFSKGIPASEPFISLYAEATGAAIAAADALGDPPKRITELLRIAADVPRTRDFLPHRAQAWRLALGLPDKPRYREPDLKKVAKELPKTCDLAFYRRYTLLGIASELYKEGVFTDVYKEAMNLAISASAHIDEPYYRRYALMFIAGELPQDPEFHSMYKKAMELSFEAACATKDPFARQRGFLDIIAELPKTEDLYPLLQKVIEESLRFFTVKKRMDDLEIFDVVDFILSAEDTGVTESKQKRFTRENYAGLFSKELDKFGLHLNDTRFIEVFRPYTHVWVQPKTLRDSVKKVVDHLESLKDTYHGKEMERPVFVKETHPASVSSKAAPRPATAPQECIAIDIGATNTVIARKRKGTAPEVLSFAPASVQYDGVPVIPTVLSARSGAIGAEVADESPIANIKQMLLDGNQKGKPHMERFFKALYGHVKKASPAGGWFTVFSRGLSDVLYLTVPIGFTDYKNTIKEIAERTFKGQRIEFIEEPLAAAVGYQVAEEREKVLMIIDFGGSTLNAMLVRLSFNTVHVISKPDRAYVLGGHDIDVWLAGYLASKAGVKEEPLPYKLVSKAEQVKIMLSKNSEAVFEWNGAAVCKVTRDELEEVLNRHEFYRFIDRSINHVVRRAEKVGLRKDRIEGVLLTGGSSQIPSFREKIGDIFPSLRDRNLVFDHSPLSAVAHGASLYGTREVVDKHLGMAYAVRYATSAEKEPAHSYSILLEKGELLPLQKSFKVLPARKLGRQSEMYLELFEVPDSHISRRWVKEEGIEFLKQELTQARDVTLRPLKIVTMPFKEPIRGDVPMTLCVDDSGSLRIEYGLEGNVVETGLRLQ